MQRLNWVCFNCKDCHVRFDVSIWNLSFCKLYCCNSQWPNISFIIILCVFDDLWAHPIRASNMCFKTSICLHWRSRNTKISKFSISLLIQQNIGSFNIPMNFFPGMNIIKPFQCWFQNRRNLKLIKFFLSNLHNICYTPSNTIFHNDP